jgi:mannose-1-phosphate guanylyltransferase
MIHKARKQVCMEHFYALILAGGGGTRLWPVSRKDTPKQNLPLIHEDTMFQVAVNRLLPLFPAERIFIVTGRNYVAQMHQDAPVIPLENFITEPFGRDNGPAVALALTHIHHRDPLATVAMVTADHHIGEEARFREALTAAYQIAQEGRIVTLGIKPTFPSTGFGYIQRGAKEGNTHGFDYFRALKFTEKPKLAMAERFLASRQYSWNSGMFIWTSAQGLAEFARQQPNIMSLLDTLQPTIGTDQYDHTLDAIWQDMPKKSIDYAIMEGAQNMTVIPVDIGWNDVGSWASVFDILEKDGLGNCVKGKLADKYIPINANSTFVYSDRLVVAIGVEDIIVVETDDVLLICHKDRTQDVKEVVQYLSENGNSDYL